MLRNGTLEFIGWVNLGISMVIGVIIRVMYNLGIVDRYMDYAGRGIMQYSFWMVILLVVITMVYDNIVYFKERKKKSLKKK